VLVGKTILRLPFFIGNFVTVYGVGERKHYVESLFTDKKISQVGGLFLVTGTLVHALFWLALLPQYSSGVLPCITAGA
jgi:UDP-N-acetylmuramyl pentapeptide phosphotransferase/UDP-N-acetylglucosamine-1-phosphate transferase